MNTFVTINVDDNIFRMVIIVASIIALTILLAELLKFHTNKRKSEKELVMNLVDILISEKKHEITITGLKKHSENIKVELNKE